MLLHVVRSGIAVLVPLLLVAGVAAQGANDCSVATSIAGTGSFAVSTVGATDSPQQSGACTVAHDDVWFRWTAAQSGTALVRTCGGTGNGCANSVFAAGANLSASGAASVSADTLVPSASSLTGSVAVFFQGARSTPATPIDDGIGCVGGPIIRLGSPSVGRAASAYPGPGNPSVSVRGAIPPAGGSYAYQCFYRSAAAAFCPPATSNRTNGLAAAWSP